MHETHINVYLKGFIEKTSWICRNRNLTTTFFYLYQNNSRRTEVFLIKRKLKSNLYACIYSVDHWNIAQTCSDSDYVLLYNWINTETDSTITSSLPNRLKWMKFIYITIKIIVLFLAVQFLWSFFFLSCLLTGWRGLKRCSPLLSYHRKKPTARN